MSISDFEDENGEIIDCNLRAHSSLNRLKKYYENFCKKES